MGKKYKPNKPVPFGYDYEGNTNNNVFDGNHFEPYDDSKERPILNYDFYNAYLEYKELEKRYSSTSIIESGGLDNYELYKLKMNYPLSRRERNKLKKNKERSEEIDKLLKKGSLELGCMMFIAAVFICIVFAALFIEIVKNISDDRLAPLAGFVMFLLETGTIFLLIMLLKWARNKKKFNKLKTEFDQNKRTIGDDTPNVHPYFRLCNNLTFMSGSGINIVYPTKTIDEKYKKSKYYIEQEWKITSHKFITDRFFRMKVLDFQFPDRNHYRIFVEIKYEECFPDYPELINIENQLETLSFNLDEYENTARSLSDFKSMIKRQVTVLIRERIPEMKLKEVIVAAGCIGKNNK